MHKIKDKVKYLLLHLLSPKEFIFICIVLILSFFFFINSLQNISNYFLKDRISYSGNITEGIAGEINTLNPYKNTTQAEKDISTLIYSSLIKNVKSNNYDYALSERIEIKQNKPQDRDTEFTIYLKNKIFFSNGIEIKQEDIIYSLSLVNIEEKYEIKKIDDKTFKVIFEKSEKNKTNFLEYLTYPIIPKNERKEILENYDNLDNNIVTSGFFKIKEVNQRVNTGNKIESIVLERFNNGTSKIPYLKTYTLKFYNDNEDAYVAFQKKEIDAFSGVSGNVISKIKDDTRISFETANLPNNFALFLNQNKNELLRSSELRQLLSNSIDRKSLVDQVLGGFGLPEKTLLEENEKVSEENLKKEINNLPSSFSFENGVLYTSTKKAPNTKTKIKIFLTTIDNPELIETTKFITNSWKKIGIETQVNIINKKDLTSTVRDRNFEALLFGFSIKNLEDYNTFFNSSERTFPKKNIANYTNKSVDNILEKLNSEQENNKKRKLIQELSNIIKNDNPIILLYKPQFVFAHFLGSKIKLAEQIKSEEERYLHIQDWYINTEKVLNIFTKFQFTNKLETLLY